MLIKGVDYSPVAQEAFDEQEEWAERVQCKNIDELNKAIEKGYASGYILISEALQERKIAKIADFVANHPAIKIILIAGPSSSGKTSFTQRLRIQLGVNAIGTEYLSMDNYFVERKDTPLNPDGSYNFDTPECIDVNLFNEQLNALAEGKKVAIPRFNFNTGTKEYTGETLQLDAQKVLIVEGIHALNKDMTGKIEAKGKVRAVITQNIDGLHQKAGSKEVYEVHGTVAKNYCTKCGTFYSGEKVRSLIDADREVRRRKAAEEGKEWDEVHGYGLPYCSKCGAIIKPDVVLYEEGLDDYIWEKSCEYIRNADVLIVGGTSLVVYPAAGLINYYKGNKLILVNRSQTPYDSYADLVLNMGLGEVFSTV